MFQNLRQREASVHIDFLRSIMAVLIVIYHIENSFFVGYRALDNPSVGTLFFYVPLFFGTDVVMGFFVLSGYFTSGSLFRNLHEDFWSLRRYLLNRVVRLGIVLVPALLLTLFWDSLGRHFFPDNPIYLQTQNVEGTFLSGDTLGWKYFLTNLFFVQFLAEPYGTNFPLWYLAYEMWYCLLFPLVVLPFSGKLGWKKSILSLLVFGAGLWFIQGLPLRYLLVWLMGVGVRLLPKWKLSVRQAYGLTAVFLFLSMGIVVWAHTGAFKSLFSVVSTGFLMRNYLAGLSIALILYGILLNPTPRRENLYARWARTGAGFSYSLYLLHMPLLAFFNEFFVSNGLLLPSWKNGGILLFLLLVCTVYAYGVSRITEAHTESFRRFVLRIFHCSEK